MIDQPKQQLRKAFIEKMEELMEGDKTVILIYGDVGFSFMEKVIEKYPKQILNAGIAEANMMSMASGMAQEGLKPYVYTMSNFILLRPLEQVRNDICFANANVKLFGVKGGASYKFLGTSHNMSAVETQGILDGLMEHNLNVYTPKTEEGVKNLMDDEYQRHGPAYFSI